MKHINLTIGFAHIMSALLLAGCVTTNPDGSIKPCIANYVSEGGVISQEKHFTWERFDAPKDQVYASALSAFAQKGFTYTSSDKETGVITGNIMGSNKKLQANLVVQVVPDGQSAVVKITITKSSGFLMFPSDEMCGALTTMEEELKPFTRPGGNKVYSRALDLPQVEAEGFIVKPLYCNKKGDSVNCVLSFTNERENTVKLYFAEEDCKVYDDTGNQYPVTIRIGDRSSTDPNVVGIVSHMISQEFIPQLHVNVNFIAENLPQETSSVSVTFKIYSPQGNPKYIAVKDVPVQ